MITTRFVTIARTTGIKPGDLAALDDEVPASMEGLRAIRDLTTEGINVNITLLFGIERYEAVARARVRRIRSIATSATVKS